MRKPRILAVDDVPANLVALESVLDRDFELRFAASGEKALAMLQEDSDVDVILLDVQMPVMDGYECAERIKSMAGCHDIPIVFVTAVYREDPHVKRGYQVGGIDYFAKPFDPDLLRLKMSVYSSFRQKAAMLRQREHHIRETEELLKAGRKLTSVLESLPVGVLIADTEGRIVQTNDEVSRIFRATQSLESDHYGALLGWWSAGGAEIKERGGALERALRGGESSQNESIPIVCLDGARKSVLASVSPLLALDKRVVGAVIIIKDTAESMQLEAELATRVARVVAMGVELEQSLGALTPTDTPRTSS